MKMDFTSYFESGYSYLDYLEMTQALLSVNKTTGFIQSEEMVNYTRLNMARMNRWNKKAEIQFKKMEGNKSQRWLLISEPWCGDAAHALPFINILAEKLSIPLRIVLRDENEELMQAFLTNGGKSIPKLVSFDAKDHLVFDWGPRPVPLQSWLINARNNNVTMPDIFDYLQNFYNTDKGNTTVKEIINLLKE